MLETVKNKIQRTSLLNLLTFIVDATKTHGYAFAPRAEADKLHKAEPSFILIDPTVTDKEGNVKVTATEAAINALTSPAPAASTGTETSKPAPMKYDFVKLEKIPEVNRGGVKSDSYPFDDLVTFPAEPHAFYVPATESRPKPAKSLASTVASASKRYKGERKFTVRKDVKDGVEVGAFVIREK